MTRSHDLGPWGPQTSPLCMPPLRITKWLKHLLSHNFGTSFSNQNWCLCTNYKGQLVSLITKAFNFQFKLLVFLTNSLKLTLLNCLWVYIWNKQRGLNESVISESTMCAYSASTKRSSSLLCAALASVPRPQSAQVACFALPLRVCHVHGVCTTPVRRSRKSAEQLRSFWTC